MENEKTWQLAFVNAENRLLELITKKHQYPDSRLTEYQDFLHELVQKIQSHFTQKVEPDDFASFKSLISYLEACTTFLEDSILNAIPFETVFCLEKALNDWVQEEFIIVTSLQYNKYFFNSFLSLDNQILLLLKRFELEPPYKLLQISVPKNKVGNYLFNVVLYHELGHFIDYRWKISEILLKEVLEIPLNDPNYETSLNHQREFFADIFSAQYIGQAAGYYLAYSALGHRRSNTHPSPEDRINLIQNFCDSKEDEQEDCRIENFNEVISRTCLNKSLKKRYELVGTDDFYNLVPAELKNENELHGLFVTAWELWLGWNYPFDKEEESSFNNRQVYEIINNLVEKSISNYIVTESWNLNK